MCCEKRKTVIKKIILIVAILLGSTSKGITQGKRKKKTIIKYKKYEKADLGKISVDGEFSSPIDIFVRKGSQDKIKQRLYIRKHFKREIYSDILELR